MMTEPVQEIQSMAMEKEISLGDLKLECCGEFRDGQGSVFIAVARPVDEYAGGVNLPIFYYDNPKNERQRRWQEESGYSGFDLDGPSLEIVSRIYEFTKMGLPAILAVKAAYDGMDVEDVREILPKVKARIIGFGADFSGRGKTMLSAVVSHLRNDILVVSGGVFSDNDVKKYGKAIEEMSKDVGLFNFEQAVEKMKAVAMEDHGKGGGTAKDVVDRIWEAWFNNVDKKTILVDLSARSEEASYPANSFGLLRFAMATFDVQRFPYGDSVQVSAAEDITAEVVEDNWRQFNLKFNSRVLVEAKRLESWFEKSVEPR